MRKATSCILIVTMLLASCAPRVSQTLDVDAEATTSAEITDMLNAFNSEELLEVWIITGESFVAKFQSFHDGTLSVRSKWYSPDYKHAGGLQDGRLDYQLEELARLKPHAMSSREKRNEAFVSRVVIVGAIVVTLAAMAIASIKEQTKGLW